ncbi:hypothetical protein [uncultured Tenacibaculum sp.]|uniref:hypothetical protein n=1 Tax=uncultured Tenacibaculum sp. TaxID=174713 RepID=UPI00261AF00D|nr:hypothetical protein [uncultured Tenacibaculum sp.]
MNVNFIAKKTLIIAVTALTIASCSDEDGNLLPEDNSSSEVQNENVSSELQDDPFEKGAFVYNEKGERIPEEDFLKQQGLLDGSNNSLRARNVDYQERYRVSDKALDRYGIKSSNIAKVRERYARNNHYDRNFTNHKNALQMPETFLIGCRRVNSDRFNSGSCTEYGKKIPFDFVLKRRRRPNFMSSRRLQGPRILTSVEKRGWKNSPRKLSNQRFYQYDETNSTAITRTRTNSATLGVSFGLTLSKKFFGIGAEINKTVSFSGTMSRENSKAVTKTSTRSHIVNFDEGNIIPKNKVCDFVLYGEQREVTRRYEVSLTVDGPATVGFRKSFTYNKHAGEAYHKGGAKYAFPDDIAKDRAKNNFDVTSTYWRYSIRRENCRNL